MKQRRRGIAALQGLLAAGLLLGGLATFPAAAGATEVSAPNPNFGGDCDTSTQTCSLMEPEGGSSTVFGTVTYTISDDTISFVVTPNPANATITEAQYCDSAVPYTEIGARLCAGIDRQFGDSGPKTQNIALTYDAVAGTYSGSADYDADEPNWVVHFVVNGSTTYVVGEVQSTPPCQDDASTVADECNPVVCPGETAPMTVDTNGDGTIDDDDCDDVTPPCQDDASTLADECNPVVCPGETAPMTVDTNGDGTIDDDDCDEVEALTIIGPTTPSSVEELAVLGVELQRVPDVRATEVQGVQVSLPEPAAAAAVAPAALARTGASTTGVLALLAGFLLALGLALVRMGRRPAGAAS